VLRTVNLLRRPQRLALYKSLKIYPMKPILNQINQKRREQTATIISSRSAPVRSGAKHFSNRYERRKVREQLRHADWALDLEN
jgi:hypothetical protein